MADIRINALATTAASTASDDFVAVDGSANGTRKLNAYSPTFGGNLTVSGATSTITLGSTNTASIAVDSNGALTVTPKAGQAVNLGNTASSAAQLFSLADYAASISLKNSSVASADVRNWAIRTDDQNFGDFNIKQSATLGGDAFSGLRRLVIDKDGNVSVPSGNLTVSGGTVNNSPASGGPLFRTIRPANTGSAAFASIPNGALSASNVEWYSGLIGSSGDYKIWAYNGSTNTFAFTSTPAGNVTLAGNLTVSGTGTSAIQGDTINLGAVGNVATVVNLFRNNASVGGMYAGNSDFNLFGGASAASHLVIKSNGNVLIGTTTDTGQKLQVKGGTRITDSASASNYITIGSGNDAPYGGNSVVAQTGSLVMGTVAAASLVLYTNATTALTLDSSQNATFAGNVGVGSVSTNTDEGGALAVRKYVNRNLSYHNPAGYYAASLGKVNNTYPTVWASIDADYAQGSAVSAGLYLKSYYADANGSAAGYTIKNLVSGNPLVFSSVATATSPSGSSATENERMRLTNAGDLQLGTSSVTGARLVVVGPASASARTAIIRSVTAGDTSYSAGLFSKYDNDSTTSQVFVQFSINNDGTASGQINANGASQAAFGSWSDARLKKNIVSLGSQWNAIKSLRPVEFDYIESEGGGHQIGFIAQEVQPIYSDVVGTRPDGMFTLSGMGKNEARLIKALQEAMLRIEALEAKLA